MCLSNAAAALQVTTVRELAQFSQAELQTAVGVKQAAALAMLPQGGEDELIAERGPQKSVLVECAPFIWPSPAYHPFYLLYDGCFLFFS